MTGTPTTEHRVDTEQGDQHVVVRIDGTVVAESDRPVLVHETGLPVRYYLPPQDVDFSRLRSTQTHTVCPYKGTASYWTFTGDDGTEHPDVVWAYHDPIPSAAAIEGHLSFYDSVAEIVVIAV